MKQALKKIKMNQQEIEEFVVELLGLLKHINREEVKIFLRGCGYWHLPIYVFEILSLLQANNYIMI